MLQMIFYLIINAFRIYILYRLSNVFFSKYKREKYYGLGFVAYYLLNSFVELFAGIDLLNLTVSVGGLLIAICIQYRCQIWKKILATVMITGINILAENIAWVYFVKDREIPMEEVGFFLSVFVLLVITMVIEGGIDIRHGMDVKSSKTFPLAFVALGSVLVANILIEGQFQNAEMVVIALTVLFGINILVFYLYEQMIQNVIRENERKMNEIQIQMYQNQLSIMQQSVEDTYTLRHDMKHHMLLLADYIDRNEKEKAKEYLKTIRSNVHDDTKFVETGNVCIDTIYNFYIPIVRNTGARFETSFFVASQMNIEDYDLNIILSNLLQNAYEALQNCENKWIKSSIRYDKGVLKILIENSYCGEINEKNGAIFTSKQNKKEHGLGLASVRKRVEKYGGQMDMEYDQDSFCVTIILFIE